MIILNCEQGTPEWREARLGKPSASNFGKLITNGGKPSTSADKYISQLIAERLTGESEPIFVNEHMARGTELEPEAREHYEYITDELVEQVGFILHDSKEYGCSPDGLIKDGGLEIKCPSNNTHVHYLRYPDELVKTYYQQIQGCMMLTGAEWWDAFSYHPSMEHVLVRVERNDDYIKLLKIEVEKAVALILTEVEKQNGLRAKK